MINPFEAPTSAEDERIRARQSESKRLRRIGLGQRMFRLSLFTLIALILLSVCLGWVEIWINHTRGSKDPRFATYILSPLFYLGVILVGTLLTGAFFMTWGTIGILVAIGSIWLGAIFPVALIFWFVVSKRATILLRRANIKTGLFGPRLSDLPVMEIAEREVDA